MTARACLALATLALTTAALGCATEDDASAPQPGDKTIGYYCDLLLPAFCQYAVDRCGVGGTEASCVEAARSSCCQGACGRAARWSGGVDAEDAGVTACIQSYAGDDAGAPGLSCDLVRAGFTPVPCREAVQLLSPPGPTSAR